MLTTDTAERVIVSAQVPRDLRDKLERRAAAADRNLSGEIRRALREHLARADGDGEEGEA